MQFYLSQRYPPQSLHNWFFFLSILLRNHLSVLWRSMGSRTDFDMNMKEFTHSKSMGSYSQSQFRQQSASSPHRFGMNSNCNIQTSNNFNHQVQGNANYNGNGGAPRMTKSKSGSWILDDAEIQRRKRVASYKSYTVEDRFKSSFRKSFRWIKDKCSNIRHGLW